MQALVEGGNMGWATSEVPGSPPNKHLQHLLQQVSQQRDALQSQLENAQVMLLTNWFNL